MLTYVLLGLFAAAAVTLVAWLLLSAIRTGAWRAFASRAGFEYRDKHYSWDDRYPFRLFRSGCRQMVRNLVHGARDGCALAACDFWYWTRHPWSFGSARGGLLAWARSDVGSPYSRDFFDRSHTRTVCVLEDEHLRLPTMFLRREWFLVDWVKQQLGEKDFDFRDDDAFSGAYVVQGLVESEVRSALSLETRRLLVERRGRIATLETNGPYILIDCGRRVSPSACDDLIDLALQLRSLWGTRT